MVALLDDGLATLVGGYSSWWRAGGDTVSSVPDDCDSGTLHAEGAV
jgi:hypothetical protein